MAAPTIADTLKIAPPVFIRKLGRPNHWGQPGDPLPERVKAAVQQVFRNQPQPEISIYLIATDDDLRRVAIGLNAGRSSLKEDIAFVAFTSAELQVASITLPAKTPGALKCDYANSLHHDMTATDAQLEKLCTDLMNSGRQAARCGKGVMTDAETLTIQEKCKSVPNIDKCGVEACQPVVSGT